MLSSQLRAMTGISPMTGPDRQVTHLPTVWIRAGAPRHRCRQHLTSATAGRASRLAGDCLGTLPASVDARAIGLAGFGPAEGSVNKSAAPHARHRRQPCALRCLGLRERQDSELTPLVRNGGVTAIPSLLVRHIALCEYGQRDAVRQDAARAHRRSFPHRLRPGLSRRRNSVGAGHGGQSARLPDSLQIEHAEGALGYQTTASSAWKWPGSLSRPGGEPTDTGGCAYASSRFTLENV